MKKIIKLFTFVFVMAVIFLGFNSSVSANSISVYSKEHLKNIRSLDPNVDTTFYMLSTTNNELVYCIKSKFSAPLNPTTYNYISDIGATIDSTKVPGIISIINDSSNDSIMMNNYGEVLPERERYYVAQIALWYYLEGTNGLLTPAGIEWIESSIYSNAFYVLMSNAKSAVAKKATISLVSHDGSNVVQSMSLKNGSNIMLSDTIFEVKFTDSANSNEEYEVSLPNSDGVKTYITNEDGSENYGSKHTFSKGDKFRIAIDTTNLENGEISESFIINSTVLENEYSLRAYVAYDSSLGFQDVALVRTGNYALTTDFTVKGTVETKTEIEVLKVDSEGNKVNNATIGIYNMNDELITKVISSDKNEKISLSAGDYYLKEIEAPKGYLINSKVVKFSIDENGNLKDESNNVISTKSISIVNDLPKIKLQKLNERNVHVNGAKIVICSVNLETKEESDCNFEWISDGTVKELVIGKDFGKIDDISYVIKEVSAPHGYEISEPKYITVKDGKVYGDLDKDTVTIVNRSYLDVSKTDATGQNEIEGAKIKLLDENGKVLEEWESKKEAHRIYGLDTKQIYELVETLAPNGYVPLETSIKFKLNEDGTVTTCNVKIDEKNNKTCEAMSKEDIMKIKNDVTKLKISKIDVTNQEELPGAKLQILDKDGKPVSQNGKILEWISTNEPHYIEMLPIGKYKLVETVSPEGYVAVTSEVLFEVKSTNEIQTVVFENDVTKVMISKKDFTTGEEIEGATLQILDKDGNPVSQNGEILKWVSTKEPHYIEKLPIGEYILVETFTPEGYKSGMIIDGVVTNKYEFEVKDNVLVKIDVYNEVMVDVPKTGLNSNSTYIIGGMFMLVGFGFVGFNLKKNKETL